MATATLNPSVQAPSPLNHPRQQKRHIPKKPSPLACSVSIPPTTSSNDASNNTGFPSKSNIAARRAPYFPTSRPLRPFPSITPKASSKPVKTFELPEAFKSGCFMLNLTQAEFSRQE